MRTKRNQSPVDIEKYSFDIFNHLFLFLAVRSSDGDFPKCRLTYLPKKGSQSLNGMLSPLLNNPC